MLKLPTFEITNKWVLSHRPKKEKAFIHKPYAFLVEKERTRDGKVVDVATIFLTNRECPFKCLMCDLWKYTTDETVPPGTIPNQIEYALNRLATTKHVKLYNSGNFFDPKAIPPADYDAITAMLHDFDTVLVENHPKLTDEKVVTFRDKLGTELQVAMGLETIHPRILPLLNKNMTVDDFAGAVAFLNKHDIPSRAFILLRPPFLDEGGAIVWAKKSLDFAFDAGVECCVIIPVRAGNGAMDFLQKNDYFRPPDISSLEEVLSYGISLRQGRVFADLWDLEQFSKCDKCLEARRDHLRIMNLQQIILTPVQCECNA